MDISGIDFYRHVSLHVNSLKFFGIWFYIPYPANTLKYWFSVLMKIAIIFFSYIMSTGGQVIYLLRLIVSGKSNILEVTGIANLVLTEMVAEFRLLDMWIHRDMLTSLIDQMNSKEFQCHSKPEKDICEKAIKFSRRLFIVIMICAHLDVFVHVVVVPAVDKFEKLPLKMDLIFFDVNDPKVFKYICAYQILYKPWMVTTFATFQSFTWAAMSFTMSQLDVLIYNFENMKELVKSTRAERNCDGNEAFCRTFRQFVLHHSSIMRFIRTLQATFSAQLSAFLFISTTIIGTTALQFFSIDAPLQHFTDVVWLFIYLAVIVGMLFVDCFFGNAITSKCEHLSTCVFSCPWVHIDNSQKKNIVLFIAKTQQPVIITAAKLVPISLETFTKVMNWTYKGFAVMNQMK